MEEEREQEDDDPSLSPASRGLAPWSSRCQDTPAPLPGLVVPGWSVGGSCLSLSLCLSVSVSLALPRPTGAV